MISIYMTILVQEFAWSPTHTASLISISYIVMYSGSIVHLLAQSLIMEDLSVPQQTISWPDWEISCALSKGFLSQTNT